MQYEEENVIQLVVCYFFFSLDCFSLLVFSCFKRSDRIGAERRGGVTFGSQDARIKRSRQMWACCIFQSIVFDCICLFAFLIFHLHNNIGTKRYTLEQWVLDAFLHRPCAQLRVFLCFDFLFISTPKKKCEGTITALSFLFVLLLFMQLKKETILLWIKITSSAIFSENLFFFFIVRTVFALWRMEQHKQPEQAVLYVI